MTRLLLVRHGQTTSNVTKALDSRPPGPPLTALGRAQAAALGERLAAEPVTAVYASTAVRAQETAAPVASAHGLEVQVVDGVHEVFCGDLEGRADGEAREQFEDVYAAWWRGDLGAHLPGGESALDLRARYLPVVARLVAADPAGTVVLTSHGAAIRLVAAALLGDTAETFYVPNTGIVELEPDGPGWRLVSWDTAVPEPGDVTAGGTA